ncbi:MAG: hypothetical protein LBT13_05960 [Treponema sp.]|jgi:hypothetical protein|nr:hypothetical protein [Treponema sp.]
MKKGSIPAGIIIGWVLCSTSCISLVEKGGQLLNGSAFAEKTLAVYRTQAAGKGKRYIEVRQVRQRKGEEQLLLSSWAFPTLRLRGSVPGNDGSFYLLSLDFLASHYTGWNEFTLDLSGLGGFMVQGTTGTLRLTGPIEPIAISNGKIRHRNSRLTGTQALTELRNRYDRIQAIVEWMHTQPGVPAFTDQKAFEAYWKPLLMPELVFAKKRPPTFSLKNAVWVRAEDIKWNSTYTETLFPEDIRILRNSGALLRDWEEAVSWMYFVYEWDHLVESMQDVPLTKIK